jgi:hypothetical protein
MHRTLLFLPALAILCAPPGAGAAAQNHDRVLQAQDRFFERAVHPETHLLYGGIDPEDPQRWTKAVFPTPDDVRRRSGMLDLMYHDPADSAKADIANCARDTALFLAAIVDAAAVTKARHLPEQAETLFQGLRALARVAPRKGFVATGILPRDRTAFLNASSTDQYTGFVYGLWKYARAPFCPPDARSEIREIIGEICAAIEKDGFAIMAANGIPAPECDIAALRSNRSSRILMIYLAGHDLTGNAHWLEIYRELLQEQDEARLKTLLNRERVKFPHIPADKEQNRIRFDQIWQTQYSLAPLFDLETDPEAKAAYSEAMRLNADIAAANPQFGSRELAVLALAPEIPPGKPSPGSPRIAKDREFLRLKLNEWMQRETLPADPVFFGACWSAALRLSPD